MKKIYLNIIYIIIFIISIFLFDNILLFINADQKEENNIEITLLKEENETLKKELNDTLELNNLDKYMEYDYIKSVVLLRDIYNFHETITIKYGSDQNIKEGMAVVAPSGLIGIVQKVNKDTSVVKLITSNNLDISISIDENYGVLNKYENNKLIASNFNNYEMIMKNDEVYTSGLGLIPEGLYIGKVQRSENINQDIEQKVYIQSEVNFKNIKYIAIIKGIKNI